MSSDVRIGMSDEEFIHILYSIYTDSKLDTDAHAKLNRRLRKIAIKIGYNDILDEIDTINGLVDDDETDYLIEPLEDNPEGIFYCPKCKVQTNEKTIRTTCVRGARMSDARRVKCLSCNYQWHTKSTMLIVTCPSCLRKTPNKEEL
jgi:hypothetical protein